MRAIDVHAHLVPFSVIDAVREGRVPAVSLEETRGAVLLIAGDRRLGPIPLSLTDTGRRLEWMDERGVAEQWLSPWLDLFTWHRLPAPEARSWSTLVNDCLSEVAGESGGRLRAVPFIDVTVGPATALTALSEAIRGPTPPAVMVNSWPGMSLADRSLEPWWEGAVERNVTVLLHPPGNGPSCAFTPAALQNVSGRVIDASAAVLELMIAGVFERLPQLRVIAVHGGGFLPYQAFRLDGLRRTDLTKKTHMTRSVSETLPGLWFDTVALDPPSLELLVHRVGRSQVLLGSDAPFSIGVPNLVGTVLLAALSEEAKRAICRDNARAFDAITSMRPMREDLQ